MDDKLRWVLLLVGRCSADYSINIAVRENAYPAERICIGTCKHVQHTPVVVAIQLELKSTAKT